MSNKLLKPDVGIRAYLEARFSISFQNRGKSVMSVCPFHTHASTNTNLRIWDEDNTYVCSCDQEGGTMWDLMHKHEGLPNFGSPDFDETILHVCRVMGLQPQLRADAKADVTDTIREVYRAFSNALQAITFPAPNAHFSVDPDRADRYLYRGVDVMSWLAAGVGMLPQATVRDLVQRLGPKRLQAAGVKGWKNNTSWDFLSKGVVILRKNHHGTPVGLGVRFYDLPGVDIKYWKNSNHKLNEARDYLFGYHTAAQKSNRSPRVFVVEGEIDTLQPHLRGFPSVVSAGMGVVSDTQIEALRALDKEIVLVTDADPNGAGQNNARDMAEQFPDLRFMRLPPVGGQKMDPDVFVQRFGVDAFTALPIESARMTRMMSEDMVETAPGKVKWRYPEPLVTKYMGEVLRNPSAYAMREVEYVAGLADQPVDQLKSWVLKTRNRQAVDYAAQHGLPLEVRPVVTEAA
jgi:DNA primase